MSDWKLVGFLDYIIRDLEQVLGAEEGVCVCGHALIAHQGHAHPPGTPEPKFCSQGCGCRYFKKRS